MIDHWSATYLARYVKLQHKRSAHNRICAMCPTSEFEIVFSHSSVCLASFQHCQGHLWKDLKRADTAQSKMASIGWWYAPSNWYDMMIWWGELAKQIFGQSWDFVPTRGGGSLDKVQQLFWTFSLDVLVHSLTVSFSSVDRLVAAPNRHRGPVCLFTLPWLSQVTIQIILSQDLHQIHGPHHHIHDHIHGDDSDYFISWSSPYPWWPIVTISVTDFWAHQCSSPSWVRSSSLFHSSDAVARSRRATYSQGDGGDGDNVHDGLSPRIVLSYSV